MAEGWGSSAVKGLGSMWKSAKESKDWLSVWTTVWPLWDHAQVGTPLGPGLVWLRHDRVAECVEVGTFGLGGFRREFASNGTQNQGQNPDVRVEHLNQWTQVIKFSRWGQDMLITVSTEGYGSQTLHKVAKKVAMVSASALETLSYTLTVNGNEVKADDRERPVSKALAERVASRISVPQYREEVQVHNGVQEKVKQYAIRSIADAETGVSQERVIWVRFSEITELHNNICSCYTMADSSSLSLQSEVAKPPPKTWGPSASGHAFLEQRRHAIQGYLHKMICTPRGLRNPYLLIFLGLNTPTEPTVPSPRRSFPAGPVPGAQAMADQFMRKPETAPEPAVEPTSQSPLSLGMPPKSAAPRPLVQPADLFGNDDDNGDVDEGGELFESAAPAPALAVAKASEEAPKPAAPAPAPSSGSGGLFGEDDGEEGGDGLFESALPPPAVASALESTPAAAADEGGLFDDDDGLLDNAAPAPTPARSADPTPASDVGGLFDDDDLIDAAPAPAPSTSDATPAATDAITAKRYRCVKKAQARAGFEMDSEKTTELAVGAVIDVISAKVNDAGVLRVQYSEGWVSEKTAKGQLCLQAEEAVETSAAPAAASAADDAVAAKAKADVLVHNKSADGEADSLDPRPLALLVLDWNIFVSLPLPVGWFLAVA